MYFLSKAMLTTMKFLYVIFLGFLGTCVGYHLNSTRQESFSSLLWKKFSRDFEKTSAEEFGHEFFSRFRCLDPKKCNNCTTVPEHLKLLEGLKMMTLTGDNLIEISNRLLTQAVHFNVDCFSNANVGNLPCESVSCLEGYLATTIFGYGEFLYHDVDPVDKGLKAIKKIGYQPKNLEQCFTANDLFKDFAGDDVTKLRRDDVKFFVTALTMHMAKGECISINNDVDFLEDLFFQYGNKDVITANGLEVIMISIGIDHNHAHGHKLDHEIDHDHAIEKGHDDYRDTYHNPTSSSISSSTSSMLPQQGHEHNEHEFIGKIQLLRVNDNNERSNLSSSKYDVSNLRQKRSSSWTLPGKNNTEDCWSANDLFLKFDADKSKGLDRDEFLHACPALIQQRLRGKCVESSVTESATLAEVYGYGTLTVFIISLCSILGVILMPIQKSNLYQYIMMCFIALAFGTLTGDALLHLIPEAVGLHVHGDQDHHHHHDANDGIELPSYFWKFITLLAAIYGLFVVETLSQMFVGPIHHDHEDEGGHGHSHVPNVDLVRMVTKKDENKTISTETLSSRASGAANLNTDTNRRGESNVTRQSQCWGLSTLALVIIVGDGIHNIADGLTIGAAFTSNIKGGISSALAIFFHELPHEFGDFVILLSTGLSYKKALFWNFVSSLTAFVGLYIGIELGENAVARQWILAVAAGMFLYIALGDMLPELKGQKCKNKLLGFIAQNIGVLAGMIFMIVIGVFEERIKI